MAHQTVGGRCTGRPAGRYHAVVDAGRGRCRHGRGVGHAVAARGGAAWQGADDWAGGVAGVDAGAGHGTKAQAAAQGVGQALHRGGRAAGDGAGQGVGDHATHRHRAARGWAGALNNGGSCNSISIRRRTTYRRAICIR